MSARRVAPRAAIASSAGGDPMAGKLRAGLSVPSSLLSMAAGGS
jgi:hypothetical protein